MNVSRLWNNLTITQTEMGRILGVTQQRVGQLIKEGVNGYLCEAKNPRDLADKIDTLLAQDFKTMGKDSLEIVTKDFDWDIIAKATLREYRGLL